MTENKLPEGVGKKIVEALKKQSEIEITPIKENPVVEEEAENLITDEVENMFAEEIVEENLQQEQPQEQVQSSMHAQAQENMMYQAQQQQTMQQMYQQPTQNYYEQDSYVAPQPQMYQQMQQNSYVDPVQPMYQTAKEFTIPANVAVLKRLILQLPQGVSKQTGAQIIRQTMEALGISMSTVLTEAQNFQDDLNTAIRDCAGNIQEYKNSIRNLEKQVGDYQKQSAQVNDLISLFIMTDK